MKESQLIAFLFLIFFGVVVLQFGMAHGRKLEAKETVGANKVYTELVGCIELRLKVEQFKKLYADNGIDG